MGRPYFCNCHCPKPVPWLGEIYRHIYPTAITDYESLSNASWSTDDIPLGYWYSTRTKHNFTSSEASCYYYVLDVSDPIAGASKIMDPIRWTIEEASTSGGYFDHWIPGDPTAPYGSYGFSQVSSFHELASKRNNFQPLSQTTLLPLSGNSHIAEGSPNMITFNYSYYNACVAKLYWDYTGWAGWPNINSWGNAFRNPYANNGGMRPRYIQFRLNGSAYGTLIDLEDYVAWADNYATSTYGETGRRWVSELPHPFTIWFNNHPYYGGSWPAINSLFEFTAGDTFEVDIWYEVIANAWYNSRNEIQCGTASKAIACIPRHMADDGDRVFSVTPAAGEDFTGSYWQFGVNLSKNGVIHTVGFHSLEVSPTFDPDYHTYNIVADDGAFTFGKAELSGSTSFTCNSQGLTWVFNRTDGGGLEPGTGDSDWISYNGDPWTLQSNNCTVGSPVSPDYDPPAPSFPPSNTIATGSCVTTGTVPVRIEVTMKWDKEIAYLVVGWYWTNGVYDDDNEWVWYTASAQRYYRPVSNSDYVENVNSREWGTILSGATGTFDYDETTVFTRWSGTQNAATYDVDLWSTGASRPEVVNRLANSFTITRVAK